MHGQELQRHAALIVEAVVEARWDRHTVTRLHHDLVIVA